MGGKGEEGEKQQQHDFILLMKKLKLWEVKEIAQDNTVSSRVRIPICLPPKLLFLLCYIQDQFLHACLTYSLDLSRENCSCGSLDFHNILCELLPWYL